MTGLLTRLFDWLSCFFSNKKKPEKGEETLPFHCPVVLLGGFLAPRRGLEYYWGSAQEHHSRLIFVNPSGVASSYDRACEIFYQIKGGCVDYGKEHADEFKHARFGATYPGLYPEWDEEHPLHFIGHSFGGCTLRVLQHLLQLQHFRGCKTSADWMRSLTTISSPLNGALGVYAIAAPEPLSTRCPMFSTGWALGVTIHVYEFLDIAFLKKYFFDFGLQYWHLSWRYGWSAVKHLWEGIFGRSPFYQYEDNSGYDMSIHGALDWNKKLSDSPNTYYVSVVNRRKKRGRWRCRPKHLWLLWIRWKFTSWDYTSLAAARPDFCIPQRREARPNGGGDAICSAFTQSHPRLPIGRESPFKIVPRVSDETTGRTLLHFPTANQLRESPGVWHVVYYSQDHLGVVPLPDKRFSQTEFFRELLTLLRSLDETLLLSSKKKKKTRKRNKNKNKNKALSPKYLASSSRANLTKGLLTKSSKLNMNSHRERRAQTLKKQERKMTEQK